MRVIELLLKVLTVKGVSGSILLCKQPLNMYKITEKIKGYKYVLQIFLFVVITAMNGQEGNVLDNGAPLSLDPSIRYGRLGNGFTYYIKRVENGPEKINMRFYVKVGNNYQQAEELDYAHAIEHLAFKCAKDFPVNLLNDPTLLNSLGMGKSDLFAQTWNYSTWYRFDIPSNSENAFNTGLRWFTNITDLDLTEEAIIKEKGPLLQEIVFRQGDNLQKFFVKTKLKSLLIPCSNDYSDFFKLNKEYTPGTLIDFYKKWYQPDRMAIVLVGDIKNIDQIEKKVIDNFSSMKGVKTPNKWLDCVQEYLTGEKHFAYMELDSSYPGGSEEVEFFLYHRKPEIIENLENEQKIKKRLYWKLLYKLINHRLNELEKTYGNHFTSSFFPPGPYLPAMELRIRSNVNTIGKGLNKVLLTLRQLKKFGLEQNEWDELRNNYILLMEKEETDRSAYWLERIQEHFVYGEALPGNNAIDLKKWLSKLSLNEFNAALGRLISDNPDDIGIMAPKGTKFTENQVRGWIQQALLQSVEPFIRHEVPRELLSVDQKSTLKLRGYKVIGTASSGAEEIVLDNGMKVILDTLTNSKDRFYLHGFSPNGASCFPEKAYFSAINAPYIVQNSGAGSLNKFQINSYLKEHSKGLWIRPYINYNETGIKGNAAIDDLETMLQLVYLYFVHPRKDENAFTDWKIQEENRHLYPTYGISNQDFVVRIREFLKDRSKVPEGTRRLHGIRQTEMGAAYEIYRELHGDAEDFTFIISGSFSVEEVLPLLQKYLGNLPVRSNSILDETWSTKEVTLPASPLYKKFNPHGIGAGYKMKNIFYYRKYLSKVDKPMHWKELIDIEVLGYMLNSKILDLRFSVEAGLYDMIAFGTINKESSFYDIGILLNVIPSELEMLRKACKSLVKELRDKVVDREVFKDVMLNKVYPKYRVSRQHDPARRVEKLYDHYRFNEKWASPVEIEEYVKSLMPEDIMRSARKYLREDHLMEFTFEDENGNSRK